MGCGQKAWADDEDDHERAMRGTGLYGDKKYGRIGCNSREAGVVEKCYRDGKSKTDTIRALINDKHQKAADVEFKQEMEDRAALERLQSEYGAR